jgi:hypothetical protein
MTSIHDLLAATLTALGLPVPSDIIQTMLLKDRYFVGHKFLCGGGYAIMPADGRTAEFYDEQGTLLKTVAVDAAKDAA